MAAGALRGRDEIGIDLVGVAGITSLLAGLTLLRQSKDIGFDPGAVVDALGSEAPTTIPAALLVLAVTALDLGAGLAVARAARRSPFASLSEALIWAAVGALLLDLVLLGTLGQLGLFRAPILAIVLAAVAASLVRIRPVLAAGADPRSALTGVARSIPLLVLLLGVWAVPIVLQLGSPVVPFIDVLPNHVAPAEHLRAFGSFTPLTATQSPIYGPSRSLLGYVALLGTVTTVSGLQAALAVAAFILPSTILVAVGIQHLATTLQAAPDETGAAPSSAVWPWALLAVAMTTSFARLGDVRGTVVVLPFAAAGLALLGERMRGGAASTDGSRTAGGRTEPWRIPASVVIGLAVGGSVTVHPVIGALTVATVAVVGMLRPEEAAADATVAVVTATILAVPQAATMVGLALPALALPACLALAIVAGVALERALRDARRRDIVRRAANPLLRGLLILAMVALAAEATAGRLPELDLEAFGGTAKLLGDGTQLLALALVAGWLLRSPGARHPIVLAGLGVGVLAAIATVLIPTGLGLLGQALRFELPKTIHYWIPVVVAVGAAAALASAWSSDRLSHTLRIVGVGVFVAAAAYTPRVEPIDAYHLGERRLAEVVATDLRFVGRGYWVGYPDPREIVDGPRREIVDVVRGEIAAGRVGPDSQVLHLASSFQQWSATPLGVFAGVTETDITPDAEASIHTVGGRLHRPEDLDALLALRRDCTATLLLVEPAGLPAALVAQVDAAGFDVIFRNGQGTLYRLCTLPARG